MDSVHDPHTHGLVGFAGINSRRLAWYPCELGEVWCVDPTELASDCERRGLKGERGCALGERRCALDKRSKYPACLYVVAPIYVAHYHCWQAETQGITGRSTIANLSLAARW